MRKENLITMLAYNYEKERNNYNSCAALYVRSFVLYMSSYRVVRNVGLVKDKT